LGSITFCGFAALAAEWRLGRIFRRARAVALLLAGFRRATAFRAGRFFFLCFFFAI